MSRESRTGGADRLGGALPVAPALDEPVLARDGDGFRLTLAQWVPYRPEAVFPFFADPYNLEAITPPWLRFRVLGSDTVELGEGTRIDYRLRLYGLPVAWRSRIEDWQPGVRFVDTQVRGPYARWHHLHTFTLERDGTRLEDEVRYALPLGRLGTWVAGRRVAAQLRAIFAYRAQVIAERFGNRPGVMPRGEAECSPSGGGGASPG